MSSISEIDSDSDADQRTTAEVNNLEEMIGMHPRESNLTHSTQQVDPGAIFIDLVDTDESDYGTPPENEGSPEQLPTTEERSDHCEVVAEEKNDETAKLDSVPSLTKADEAVLVTTKSRSITDAQMRRVAQPSVPVPADDLEFDDALDAYGNEPKSHRLWPSLAGFNRLVTRWQPNKTATPCKPLPEPPIYGNFPVSAGTAAIPPQFNG